MGVHLAAEHALELEAAHLGLEPLGVLLDVPGGRLIALDLGQIQQFAASSMPLVVRSMSASSALSRARSLPSSCAFSGSGQMAGSSSSRLTSSSRSFLRSYSKKPPKRGDTLAEVFEMPLELIDFHLGCRRV